MTAFSFTLPLTRIVVENGRMSPLFVGAGRAVLAAALAAGALLLTRQRLPRGRQWLSLAVVAFGVVLGFPLLTSLALSRTSASHGAVVVALLPAATAVVAVLRTRERLRPSFWLAAGAGAVAALGFASLAGGGLAAPGSADLMLFAGVIVCAIAYAEGGLLARSLGSWQTISWALVVAAPVMVVLTVVAVLDQPPGTAGQDWLCFAYLGAISMFLGFFAWYRGLAIGPMAQVSQVQLAQPVMSICWAALLLHEPIAATTVLGGLAVIGCAALAVRTRGQAASPSPAVHPPATRLADHVAHPRPVGTGHLARGLGDQSAPVTASGEHRAVG
ncbi:DMT family transporter [Nocardioides dubius]